MYDAFEKSGMTQEELDEFTDELIREVRAEKQARDNMKAMNAPKVVKAKRNSRVVKEIRVERPERANLSAEESLKRINDFDNRKDKFIASIRKSEGSDAESARDEY